MNAERMELPDRQQYKNWRDGLPTKWTAQDNKTVLHAYVDGTLQTQQEVRNDIGEFVDCPNPACRAEVPIPWEDTE